MEVKVKSEEESRKNLLANARRMGCYHEIVAILDKYDRLMKTCSNKEERASISALGCHEINNLLGAVEEINVLGLAEDLVKNGKFKVQG